MEPFETFEVDGLTVELHQDPEPPSPAGWDTLGTVVSLPPLWREYAFGDRESTGMEDDALDRGGLKLLARYLSVTQGAVMVPFRFSDYGSSGATLTVTDTDDDRAAGFIMTTPARVRELCGEPVPPWDPELDPFYCPPDWQGTPADWVRGQLEGELREWRTWLEGAVVGIVVKDVNGNVLESVWGCYPDDEGDGLGWIREEGRAMAAAEAEAIREKTRRVARAWASLYLSRGYGAVVS